MALYEEDEEVVVVIEEVSFLADNIRDLLKRMSKVESELEITKKKLANAEKSISDLLVVLTGGRL